MDYSQYENYGFDRFSAFNMSTGYEERSYRPWVQMENDR